MEAPAAALRHTLSDYGRAGDDAFGLGEAALVVAALERPKAKLDEYIAYLGELGDAIGGLASRGDDAAGMAVRLAEVMAKGHRYRGDDRDDDDTANANLMWVIDRRRGTAEALGILYLEAARRGGWAAEGLAFPSHFLVRLEDGDGQRVIVDPFAGGQTLGTPEMRAMLKAVSGNAAELEPGHYAPLDGRGILVRLLNHTKLRLLRCGRIDRALAVVEMVLLFAPDRALLWREAGLMHMRLDNLGAAVAALEQFCTRTTNGPAKARTLSLLAELKGRMS